MRSDKRREEVGRDGFDKRGGEERGRKLRGGEGRRCRDIEQR